MTIARAHFVAFVLLAFAATSVRSNGQDADADAAYAYSNGLGDLYSEQLRTSEDGLPSNEIHAVAQTNDGFLWIGTTRGLARFDGTHFRRVTTTGGPRDHDDCSSLLCD